MRKTLLAFGLSAIASVAMAQIPAGVPTNGLQSYYSFNSSSADLQSGHDLAGSGVAFANDRYGNASGSVAVNGPNFLQNAAFPFPSGDFTVAFWLYSEVNQTGGLRTVVEIDESIFIRYSGSQSWLTGLAGFLAPDISNYALLDAGLFPNPTNAWHHVVLTNAAATGCRVYVDDVFLDGDLAVGGAASATPGMGLTVGTGTSAGAENPDKRFNGRVDDLYIYNRALTEQEVTVLFNQANDGGNPPLNCSVGNLLVTEGQSICRSNIVEFIEAGTASVPPGGDIQWQATFTGGGTSFTSSGVFSQEPYELPLSVGGQFNVSYTFNVRDANSAVCATETVNVVILDSEDPACDGQAICNVGNVLISSGAQICVGESVDFIQEGTTVFPPGVNFLSYRFTQPGDPQGFAGTTSNPWTYTPSQPPGIYNLEMVVRFAGNVGICDEVNIEVELLDPNDPACGAPAPCTAGQFAIADGLQLCPGQSAQPLVQGSADAGLITYALVPLEGQQTGLDETVASGGILNISSTPTQDITLEGLYELRVMAYQQGGAEACDMISITVEFLAETDEACLCEIGTLMVDNGTVICPGETVTILTGNVQIPADRELSFEIYDYPDFNIYYEEQTPFEAPYTFTHDGTYFGEAVFYVYTFGSGPATPTDLHTRGGGGGDICGFYEVFVTLAESTDAECLATGINDLSGAAISLQPNPTSGLVQLVGTTKGDLVEVTDMTGRLIGSTTLEADNGTIDLSAMTSGIYLLRTAGGVFKVVKE